MSRWEEKEVSHTNKSWIRHYSKSYDYENNDKYMQKPEIQ